MIDGVEYVLDGTTQLPPGFDQFDPFGPLPSDVVIIDGGTQLPPGFFSDVPPEYAFFVDPTLPIPPEFAFLEDPRLPVPPKYQFMFDERLPVPPEWTWLFDPGPAGTVAQAAEDAVAPVEQPVDDEAPATAPEPEPEPEAEPEPTSEPRVAVDLSPLADEDPVAEAEPASSDDTPAQDAAEDPPSEEPTATVAVSDPFAAQQTAADRDPASNLLVPLLVFVAIASTALLASVPVFLRQRSSTDSALRELVLTDDLTKLANRRRLDRDLRTHQQGKKTIAVAMIDIDHFKRLNDDYSHAVGDLVLQHVAATISQNVRSKDVAYRYGGEEFCVLLPGATENEAAAVVDRVRRAIEALQFEFLDRAVTISAGVAVAPSGQGLGDQATVRQADAALYAAKGAGRNRVMLSSLVTASA